MRLLERKGTTVPFLSRICFVHMGVQADFFPSAQKIFPFSNLNPFPFEPMETNVREDNFSKMKESSSIFIVGEWIYNVKFNMNAQTWLLNHYWLFLLEYFFSSQGGRWSKRLCRPYAYGYLFQNIISFT